ncbi:MAG TPA: 2-oxoacid:acceptor oxidoreductase family protein [Gaiellaceae bacterium]|jgi:pyruvate ferredoxin oxidoreductase gamma subunit
MKEIRWHARAGQGAKTAAQLYASAAMRSGREAQAFPEYGPERRGAPLRAFTRVDDVPIRRHDSIAHPDVAVVLEPSLVNEVDVAEGLAPDGFVLLNAEHAPESLECVDVRCVPAARLAGDSKFVNLVLVGALAAALGDPLEKVVAAAVDVLGAKVAPEEIRRAVEEGYGCQAR